jgi:hypothetical protein
MPRRNPIVGKHPDLFEGESPLIIPWEDFPREELLRMDRKDFTDAEWADLPEDIAGHIWDYDEEIQEQIGALADFLYDHFMYVKEPDADMMVEYHGDAFDEPLSRATDDDFDSEEIENIREEFEAFDEDDVQAALEDALRYSGHYRFELEPWNWGGYVDALSWYTLDHESFYLEGQSIRDAIEDAGIQYDRQIQDALAKVYDATDGQLDIDLDEFLRARDQRYSAYETYVDTGMALVIYPDWDEIRNAVAYDLGEPPEKEVEELPPPREPGERVLLTLKDGFELVELLPEELRDQSRKQSICVGDPRYGYGRAIKLGRTKILSLQTKAGKPKFTFEVALDQAGDVAGCVQVKGYGNRVPGWAYGEGRQGKFKQHEVEMVLECLDYLGCIPDEVDDIKPALDHMRGLRGNPVAPRKTFCDPVTLLW